MNSISVNPNYKQERLLNFFRDQKFVDCTFKIGDQEIKAHRLILACSSLVFEKMLYGNLASNEIVLCDIEVDEFSQMLEFIYTESIIFTDILNAWSMFYIAKKYILDDLVEVCLEYISDNLTLSTLVLSYEYSELYSLDAIKNQCFQDIVDGVNGVFVSDYHMKPSTLRTILKEDLVITKIDLVCKILDWAITECEFKGVSTEPENVIEILREEDILKHINKKWLLEMTCEYCNDVLVMCSCVDELTHKSLIFLSSEVEWDGDPPIEKFAKLVPFICKSKKVFKIARRIDLQPSEEFISSVSVSTEMVVSGMMLCTEMNCSVNVNDAEEYKGCIVIRFCEQYSDKNVVKPTIMNNIFPYNSQVFIPLRFAVTLRPDKIYDIRISYKNYCSEKRSSIVCSYMSDELMDKKRGYSKMYFYDFNGTLIKGIAYYPV
ncbi:BTB/POZ domain-containing protein 6-B-like [Euwallacea similis]|uniref:BTB/POZ domain-containing protein 6-B-like n=1 Tax=Euwallacea similis TaxID=1736056 RepID=UPI00344D385E